MTSSRRDRDGEERAEEPACRRADEQAHDDEQRREADRVAHDTGTRTLPSMSWITDVDADHDERELGRDRRRREHRRDRAEERSDDRDRLARAAISPRRSAAGTPSSDVGESRSRRPSCPSG